MASQEKDDRVSLPLDPEEALRALLKVDPASPAEDEPVRTKPPRDDVKPRRSVRPKQT